MNVVIGDLDDVPGCVWLATAILAYRRSRDLGPEGRPYPEEEFAFSQTRIGEMAGRVCSKTVHNARISQWTNADHPDSTYNYLRAVGRKRRLTIPGECAGINETPFDLVPDSCILLRDTRKGETLTFATLSSWVRNEYSSYLPSRSLPQPTTFRQRRRVKRETSARTLEGPAVAQMGFDTLSVQIDDVDLTFYRVPLTFSEGTNRDLFRHKNNKTLRETLRHSRYQSLRGEVERRYPEVLDQPLGEFLHQLKQGGDPFYRRFLNPYGDREYGHFFISASDWLDKRGLYMYVVDERVMYAGRCRDSFRRRINQGYGRIHPKNCYLDGQATNCRLNNLITAARSFVSLYACPLTDDDLIETAESRLIEELKPPWNVQTVGQAHGGAEA